MNYKFHKNLGGKCVNIINVKVKYVNQVRIALYVMNYSQCCYIKDRLSTLVY